MFRQKNDFGECLQWNRQIVKSAGLRLTKAAWLKTAQRLAGSLIAFFKNVLQRRNAIDPAGLDSGLVGFVA